MNGIFITGTDTNVGKTWVGIHLISALLDRKIELVLRKPVESGCDETNIENTDTYLLAKAANQLKNLNNICPNHFIRPISPVRAAKLEGVELTIATLKEQCVVEVGPDNFLYIEGAGGFYSPLCSDGLNADLAEALALPIVLVAENRLGCINQVLLNVEAINKRGLELKAVVLNKLSDDKDCRDMDNEGDLVGLLDCPIITTPFNKTTDAFNKLALLISTN